MSTLAPVVATISRITLPPVPMTSRIFDLSICIVSMRGACAESSSRVRSEEHTSELQSLMRISYAVFCLKKKTKDNPIKRMTIGHRPDQLATEHQKQQHKTVVPGRKKQTQTS